MQTSVVDRNRLFDFVFSLLPRVTGGLLVLWLSGCAPASLEELRCEGESEMKKLIVELRMLESHEDVQKASKRLRRHFNRIAELLIETRSFSLPGEEPLETVIGEELFAELARLYEVPGARAAIEAAQNEAIHRLDRSKGECSTLKRCQTIRL